MASFWSQYADPIFGGATLGVGGAQAGLGYDAATSRGAFAPTPFSVPGTGSDYSPWDFPGAPPNYIPGWNPSMSQSGTMAGMLSGINPNNQGIDEYRKEALRTGPSTWANLANSQQDMEARNAKSALASSIAGKTAQADSSLAMKGGLDSGARERIQTNAMKDALDQNQDINRTSATNKMQIGLNDEQNRISQLGALPGMENQALAPLFQKTQMQEGANQFDVNQQIGENARKNAFNLGRYQQQMGGWAAGQQANATANSGKK